MSEENVEVVRRGYEAFNRGDQEAMVADLAPTFEYLGIGAVPGFPATFQGADGWIEAVSWLRDEFDSPSVEVHELVETDGKVFAEVTLHGRGKQSGVSTSLTAWHLWTLHGGKVVRGEGFQSREQALEAAGLSE